MSRPWRIGLTVLAILIVGNLALRFLGTLTGGTPGGPRSSSYATSARGAAAYAELLGRAGHPVKQVRGLPHSTPPSAGSTAFLLDPPGVRARDLEALRTFVSGGGRLVASGLSREEMRRLVARPPQLVYSLNFPNRVRWDGLDVETGAAMWRDEGLVATRRVGSGHVDFLADSAPLHNGLLGSADNAAFGLALAAPRNRPVEFLESYHGYGAGSGLSALPFAWKLLLFGLGLAALVYMVARGRRFGPPEEEGRSLAPPRREYVDSLAAVVARSKDRDGAVRPVRREARDALLRRASLPRDGDVRFAAGRLGFTDEDAEALLRSARTDEDVVALGRAAARIRQDHP